MPAVYRHAEDAIAVDRHMIDKLIASAQQEPKRRARFNLHRTDGNAIQEMIIAFCGDSLNMPHRHHGKSESMHVLRGRVSVVIFDDGGKIMRRITLGPPWGAEPCVLRMEAPLWHTVIPIDDVVVVHETTNGPFVQGGNMEVPTWAPKPDKLGDFIRKLKEAA